MSTTQATTADELWKMPRDGMRHELVKGEIKTMSPAGFEHGAIVGLIALPLLQFVKDTRLGIVLVGDTGFRIATDPDTVRAPDLSFMSRKRIPPTGLPKAFWSGAPDLAIEVVSPGDTLEEVEDKVADWLAAGVHQVWVVKPKSRTVAIHEAANVVRILTMEDEIDGGALLPGFRCPVGDLFPN